MTAHVYWRLNITANCGDAYYLALAEIEMRATNGGADQCSGGTASASSANTTDIAANAFDNSATTLWATVHGVVAARIAYQFPSAVEVAQYTIQARPNFLAHSPKAWALEYSDDGVTWTPIETREGYTSWTAGEIKVFTVPTVPSVARTSQVVAEVIRTNTALVARTSQVVAEVLRINTGTVIRASQLAVEVLRPNAVSAVVQNSARPVVFVCT